MAEDSNSLKFSQSKNDNSLITYDILKKLHVHQHTMVIYIQNKFNEFIFICYLVMGEDGKADGRTTPSLQGISIRLRGVYIPPHLGGIYPSTFGG